ncbi:hypothetical protein N0V90_012669 [Kalmusia sp. IMI 367209]|nr:hypothetical protein N0V90_012669 [Kalmusia sp. IMI 367209]
MTEKASKLNSRSSEFEIKKKIKLVTASIKNTSMIFNSISKFLDDIKENKEYLTRTIEKFQIQITEYQQMLTSYTLKVDEFDPAISNSEAFGDDLDLMKAELHLILHWTLSRQVNILIHMVRCLTIIPWRKESVIEEQDLHNQQTLATEEMQDQDGIGVYQICGTGYKDVTQLNFQSRMEGLPRHRIHHQKTLVKKTPHVLTA